MFNPIVFTINIVFICAIMTFVPALAFAMANSKLVNGAMIWPYWGSAFLK